MNRTVAVVPQDRALTLAEICEALSAGKIQATVQNGSYHIRQSDLRNLGRRIDTTQATLAQRPTELAS